MVPGMSGDVFVSSEVKTLVRITEVEGVTEVFATEPANIVTEKGES